ncbi:hypothetical protein [Streptomyces sp. NPDC006132]|uniref:hypothetical protein n=1 Tax=Streptomyces sp. NPDC006132 TaxID=3156732 RepID=UPI0033FE3AD2
MSSRKATQAPATAAGAPPPALPSDLAVAARVAQLLLDEHQNVDHRDLFALNRAHGALTESLRILLRALGAEPGTPRTVRHTNGLTFTVIPADSYEARMARDVRQLTMEDGTVWTVGTRGSGSTIAWRPDNGDGDKGYRLTGTPGGDQRCPAAHPEDSNPCGGPVVVTVLDAENAGADGCELHAVRLLASLVGGRPVAKPDAPDGIALRIFHEASHTRPFAWREMGQ